MLLLVIELPSAGMMIDDREIGQGPTYVYAMLPSAKVYPFNWATLIAYFEIAYCGGKNR